VRLTKSIEIMDTEVTQGDFEAVMGYNPSYFGPNGAGAQCGDNCPVENITWYDAVAYANRISIIEGLSPCYSLTNATCENGGSAGSGYMDCFDTDSTSGGISGATVTINGESGVYDCEGYRLPTESEWEYAVRASSLTAFYTSSGNNGSLTNTGCSPLDTNLDQIATYCGNDSSITQKVREKEANDWDLYDMSGNVWEWVWDWYSTSYPTGDTESPAVDPSGPQNGSEKAVRGGSWDSASGDCRSAARSSSNPGSRSNTTGFRLVRTMP